MKNNRRKLFLNLSNTQCLHFNLRRYILMYETQISIYGRRYLQLLIICVWLIQQYFAFKKCKDSLGVKWIFLFFVVRRRFMGVFIPYMYQQYEYECNIDIQQHEYFRLFRQLRVFITIYPKTIVNILILSLSVGKILAIIK